MKPPQAGGGLQPVQKGVELVVVGQIVLRVDVPHKRLTGPEGAHQRVFAAHEVEVAGPEQVVKAVLADQGQGAP